MASPVHCYDLSFHGQVDVKSEVGTTVDHLENFPQTPSDARKGAHVSDAIATYCMPGKMSWERSGCGTCLRWMVDAMDKSCAREEPV